MELSSLLDIIRQNIMDAWDDGQYPSYVALHPSTFQAVTECKAYELTKGLTVLIMGLEVTCSERVPLGHVKLY